MFGFGVASFDEFVDCLVWDKWKVLLQLLLCNIASLGGLLVNVIRGGCDWGG